MAIGGLSHSTTPTYFDETSTKLNGLALNQILICSNYIGEHKNFIVLDADSIDDDAHTVQTCYENGWIGDFPSSSDKVEKKYKFQMLGSDYNNNAQEFSFARFFLRNFKSNMKIWKDGIQLSDTDWDYSVVDPLGHPGHNDYAKRITMNTAPLPAEIYDFEYTEIVDQGDNWGLKLYSSSGNNLHPAMPSKTYHSETAFNAGHQHGFLSNAAMITNDFTWKCTYTSFDVPSESKTIEKIWGDSVYISEFPKGYDLLGYKGMVLEAYKAVSNKTNNAPSPSTASIDGAGLTLMRIESKNRYYLFQDGGFSRKYAGKYYFRLRNQSTGTYSEFFNLHVSVRSIPVCVTDESLSLSNCVGHMMTSKLSS